MALMIEASGISKFYSGKKALENLTLSVQEGRVFALLGPNGAGKTTFVKIMLNLVAPTSGQVTIGGQAVSSEKSRHKVAFLPDQFSFFPYYRVEDVVAFYGQMQGLKGTELASAVSKALELAGMANDRHKKVRTISRGMLQRTGIACMLVGDNDLFIFDEPFLGLDPIGIKDLKDIIQNLKGAGKTVFINSHLLSETEKVCDDMAILHRGDVLASGNMRELIGASSLEDYFYTKVERSE